MVTETLNGTEVGVDCTRSTMEVIHQLLLLPPATTPAVPELLVHLPCAVEAHGAALPAPAGRALVRLLVRRDEAVVLERAQQQQHLEAAASITGRLAHDFGNTLTGILGFAELSLHELPQDVLPRRYLQEVCESAKAGAQWIRQLQLFSRRSHRPCQPTALGPVIAAEAERLRAAWD